MRIFLDQRKLRETIFNKRITQKDLGIKMGVSVSQVNQIINRGTCSLESLKKLAEALEIDEDSIIKKDLNFAN